MSFVSIVHFASFTVYVLLLFYVLNRRSSSQFGTLCMLMILSLAVLSLSSGLLSLHLNSLAAAALINLSAVALLSGPVLALWFHLALTQKFRLLNNRLFIICSFAVPALLILSQLVWHTGSSNPGKGLALAAIPAEPPFNYIYMVYALLLFAICGWLTLSLALKSPIRSQKKQGLLLFITGIISLLSIAAMIISKYTASAIDIPQAPDALMLTWVIGLVIATSRYGLMQITPVLASDEILSTMNDSLILIDHKARVTFANRAACALLDLTPKEMKNRSFYSLIKEEEEAGNLLKAAAARSNGRFHEFHYKSSGGQLIPVLVSVSPIRQAEGETAGFVINATDLRQQKKDQARLDEHRKLLDGIIASLPSAVLVADSRLKVVMANKLFHLEREGLAEAVQGRDLADVIDSEELIRLVGASLAGPVADNTLEIRHGSNGKSKIFSATVLPMPAENVLILFNDITSERERMDRLYLTDRLASIGEMAAGVAHEMNNPLTSVLGLSKLLLEEELPAELADDMKIIYSESSRVSAVVKNLLTFARKRPAVRQRTNIHSIIEDVLTLRAYEHKVSNISVVRNFDQGLPEVTVDYSQLQQVFINIILNAEYEMSRAHNGGTLAITTAGQPGAISITFQDDGPGIAEENLKRMFDPFFTTKEAGKGTGLGLSVCYGIVANHGGKIYASSAAAKGAVFTVELPAADTLNTIDGRSISHLKTAPAEGHWPESLIKNTKERQVL